MPRHTVRLAMFRAGKLQRHHTPAWVSGDRVGVSGVQGVARPRICAQSTSAVYEGSLLAPGKKFAVIVGQFNSLVTDRLESGALGGLRKSGVEDADVDIVHVPGSFEIPVVAKSMALTGKYDAVICIGAVVRGATTHYEEVCSAATSGCSHAAVASGAPLDTRPCESRMLLVKTCCVSHGRASDIQMCRRPERMQRNKLGGA